MTLAAVAAVFAGCQKPELDVQVENVVKDTFTASMENFEAETKTALNDLSVVWSAGDQLAIFQGSTLADKYELEAGAESVTNGKFVFADGESYAAGNEFPTNVALYPYADDLTAAVDEEDASVYYVEGFVLPTTQTYAVNSFGQAAFPMVAVTENTEDNNLKFKNLLGLVKFQFTGTQAVKSVSVKGNSFEPIAGPVTITAKADNTDPELIMSRRDAETEVTLDCGEGVQLNEDTATEFFVALPPTWFFDGFTVTVTTTDGGKATLKSDWDQEIKRSGILVMPEVEVVAALPFKVSDEDAEFTATAGAFAGEFSIEITDEKVVGFYGFFCSEENWINMGEDLLNPQNFEMIITNQLYMMSMPCAFYEGTQLECTLAEFGYPADYLAFFSNDINPGTTYKLFFMAVDQNGGIVSLEDALVYDVTTLDMTTGADFEVADPVIEEGYEGTRVIFPANENVVYARYQIFGLEDTLPTEEDYFETIIHVARNYDYSIDAFIPISENGFSIDVNNDSGVLPGAEYKLAVLFANAAGESKFEIYHVRTLPIPYNESLEVTFDGTPTYSSTGGNYGTVYATVNVPTDAVKLYYTLNTQTVYTEYSAATTIAGIVEETTSFKYVDLTEEGVVEEGQVLLTIPATSSTSNKAAVAVHVVAVDENGKVSQWVSSEAFSTLKQ